MTADIPEPPVAQAPSGSAWAPLRVTLFRWLWIGALVSNVGTWMQTVGAQWLLIDEPNAATLVALVQTAQALPVLLLAFPAGVIADLVDRRWLLLAVQGFSLAIALALTVLTALDDMTPSLLLTLTFALGAGAAIQAPAYQALIPDLVDRQMIQGASVLGAININLARAIGPAVAGLVIAQFGVAAVFGLNAASFLAFGAILVAWRRPSSAPGTEPFLSALFAGGRYVRHAPVVRRILLRCVLFVAPANVLWSLLAVVANQQLHMGAGGYGIMLTALGAGSILGAFALPRIRVRLTTSGMVAIATVLYAVALAVLAVVRVAWLGVAVLLPAGVAWIAVLATLNAMLQSFLPSWVRARGLAIYQLVLFGSMAGAAAFWGVLADRLGLATALLAAAAALVLGALSLRPWPLMDVEGINRDPALFWPEPHIVIDAAAYPGKVLVALTYTVPEDSRDEFLSIMPALKRVRRRTGGTSWNLYRDASDPDRFVEQYTVGSWDEHLLQHSGRLTGFDQAVDEHARQLSVEPVIVEHLLNATLPDE